MLSETISDPQLSMRALFTQFSFMLGLLLTLNLRVDMPTANAALIGFSAACVVYMALLLGDSIVHRLLEDRTDRVSSVVFLETPPELDESRTSVDEHHAERSGARAA